VLALGSYDGTVTLTNIEGKTLNKPSIQGHHEDMKFSEIKSEFAEEENWVSLIALSMNSDF
jgi:hypothetical protein